MGKRPRLTLDAKLTAAELKRIAFLCGWKHSGTKAVLSQDLLARAAAWTPLPATARILSIDLGIKNLAYSLVTPPQPIEKGTTRGPAGLARAQPALHTWKRLNLTTPADADELHAAFSPNNLGIVAARLVQEQFMAQRPTHVLIERQRFRTGGAASVFEWTLRVNSLEAMLHAILAHMLTTGQWTGAVIPVLSQTAGGFLLSKHPEAAPGKEGTADDIVPKLLKPTEMKKFKTKLAASMLTDRDIVYGTTDAEDAATAFLHRFDRPKGSSTCRKKTDQKETSPQADVTKLDDLADSLMQAVTWLGWEGNRKLLVERGARALLDGAD